MFEPYSDGYCPQCLLEEQKVAMQLNGEDFWECPQCQLQANSIMPGFFALLPLRAKSGQLKQAKATDQIEGWAICPAETASPYFPRPEIFSEAQLKAFLSSVVQPK
jgi:hypothetical protein